MNEKIYIYGLINPNEPDIIRYIGVTKNLNQRMDAHLKCNDGSARANWIQGLLANKITPKMILLIETNMENADTEEEKAIQKHDTPLLLNKNRIIHTNHYNKELSNKLVTFRVPERLLNDIKKIANESNLNYQTLIKLWLEDKVKDTQN
jgi:predicted DNA binding CopG/RHH family protein